MGKVAVFKLLKIILIFLSLVLAIITMLGVFAPYCDPRIYKFMPFLSLILPVLVIGSFVAGVYWLIRKEWVVGIVLLLAILANFKNITSVYQLPFKDTIQVINDRESILRVMTYNVAGFAYGASKSSSSDILKYLEDQKIDVVCIQEYSKNHIDTLANMPYKAIVDEDSTGRLQVAIFSKYPILVSEQIIFENSNNTALFADIQINGQIVRVLSFHMQTTNLSRLRKKRKVLDKVTSSGGSKIIYRIAKQTRVNFKKRSDQASVLRTIIDETDYPIIVCGDMNEPPYSYVYRNVKGRLSDGFITCGKNYGCTFNGFYQLLRIDYIFYSSQFTGITYYSPHLSFSDHYPVIMDLKFNRH